MTDPGLARPDRGPASQDRPLLGPDDEVALTAADGVTLFGRWWRPEGAARGAVVLAHGFAASTNDGDVQAVAADLRRAGLAVLAYDARGHGRSGGLCTIGDRERLDVAAALTVAGAGMDGPVVLLGVSMGAIAALGHVASTGAGPLPAGLVLVSTPALWRMSPSPVGLAILALTRTRPGRWFMGRQVRVKVQPGWGLTPAPLSIVDRVRVPVAFVHGSRDRLIRSREARLLWGRADEPRYLDIVEEMGHGLDQAGRRAAVRAVQWALAAGLDG